jgi:hypothetical protein
MLDFESLAATNTDPELVAVMKAVMQLDPEGSRTGQVLRDTLDQLYDGQRTGRYRLEQLFKTEKTHCGTLVEINLQREFGFQDGATLDYNIAATDVDCKYSQTLGGWMIPPEAQGRLCILLWADDAKSQWSMGLVRITPDRLNSGGNRDLKATLNQHGRAAIAWLFDHFPLPPNVLLQLDPGTVQRIMTKPSGQARVNELFRSATGRIIGRGVVATVAQQPDYMKRLRANGGARTALRKEGIIILGQYSSHASIARALGVPVPGPGESVSVRVTQDLGPGSGVAEIGGQYWRAANSSDPTTPAPQLPKVYRETRNF